MRRPENGDVHVMPDLPDDHPMMHVCVDCWCEPYLDSIHDGVAVWVHREHADA